MLCALTVRKLKPDTYDDFAAVWTEEDMTPGWTRAYTVRNLEDENEVVSFGFFDGTIEDLRASQKEMDYRAFAEKLAPFVESTGADGIYEVVEEVEGPVK